MYSNLRKEGQLISGALLQQVNTFPAWCLQEKQLIACAYTTLTLHDHRMVLTSFEAHPQLSRHAEIVLPSFLAEFPSQNEVCSLRSGTATLKLLGSESKTSKTAICGAKGYTHLVASL